MYIDTQRTDVDYAQNMMLLDQLYEFTLDVDGANDHPMEEKMLQIENAKPANEDFDLVQKLHEAETEIESLKSVNERLGNGILILSEKLENASNEIIRLDMLMKRQRDNVATLSRLAKNTKKYPTD